ncbi:MAG: hypothetical protein KatS3mg053_2285 [Candidatus Roseilinea sp.]|nr:MAG: hypothetical protein KatS3mg053_2285 [Candidatus Roseilinea sp.]
MKATVIADLLNVRLKPSLEGMVLGMLKKGTVVDVLSVRDGWAAVPLQVSGTNLRFGPNESDQPVGVFVSTTWLEFESEPPPDTGDISRPPRTTFKLGIHAMTNSEVAFEEARRGCKFFLCMNNFAGASQLKRAHPDAVVMVRRFFEHGVVPSVEQIINGLEGATDKNLIYIGLNEADQLGQDGNDLRRRAQLDLEVARRIKQGSGATYAAGTFSMGCPDFTNPETCQIIRELYAPAYNSGLIAFDMHLYSPNPQHIDQPNEWKWFERRWEFLFTRCGFDPKVRAIYCSECGLDQGGVGGFKAHAYSQEKFRDWCDKYIRLQSAPLVVDGKSYPSPIIGGAIFQVSDRDRWDGYEISNYLPTLRQFYAGLPVRVVPTEKALGRGAPKRTPRRSTTKRRKSVAA